MRREKVKATRKYIQRTRSFYIKLEHGKRGWRSGMGEGREHDRWKMRLNSESDVRPGVLEC